ncbi:S8 family peptidase [Nonomuraea typhae]|uniref:S8 family peptidase n=1 Tax=Nonomuraea typhae TaxID=2603600 RepID=UPI0012FC1A16|nr:S8 family peptidase [Nonomuraea typhae]
MTANGKRWAVSPLLVDDSIPKAVVGESVDSTPAHGEELLGTLVELNLHASVDPERVRRDFLEHVLPRALENLGELRPAPLPVSAAYVKCHLLRREIMRLLVLDEEQPGRNTIFRIWPDYLHHPQIDRSVSTVKADAAMRTFAADGAGVVWAVLDTGIEATHPHFAGGTLSAPDVCELHRDFSHIVRDEPAPDDSLPSTALIDEDGHGTHVAGIIAGRLSQDAKARLASMRPSAGDGFQLPPWEQRVLEPNRALAGIAPMAHLVSLKVMDTSKGFARTTSSAVIAALEHIRRVNAGGRLLRIHGVNLSLGCPWYFRDYAAGQSPLCRELDLLVGTGVVAVVSAGNGGWTQGVDGLSGTLSSITDPANADRAIAVGSTHRDKPHVYGVTYLSSKGPTLDGRLKPDLVAPGERITSCAVGAMRARIPVFAEVNGEACYAESSGTSMAAPHVSGAIAAFLSARREFMGLPDRVKRLFCETAVSLGRDRFFEGHGLVDLLAALSRV